MEKIANVQNRSQSANRKDKSAQAEERDNNTDLRQTHKQKCNIAANKKHTSNNFVQPDDDIDRSSCYNNKNQNN